MAFNDILATALTALTALSRSSGSIKSRFRMGPSRRPAAFVSHQSIDRSFHLAPPAARWRACLSFLADTESEPAPTAGDKGHARRR